MVVVVVVVDTSQDREREREIQQQACGRVSGLASSSLDSGVWKYLFFGDGPFEYREREGINTLPMKITDLSLLFLCYTFSDSERQ